MDKLTVTLDEKEKEIFLSFGLLNELTRLVDDPTRVPAIPIDPDLRNAVLAACFAERKKSGKLKEAIDIDDVDVSIEDAEKVLDWVMGHLTDFFVRAMTKVVKVTEANKAQLEGLASSLTSLQASTSETP